MREIPLSNSKLIALVDDEDFESINGYTWRLLCSKAGGTYAVASPRPRIIAYLHRIILQAPKGLVVDHIDGNGLNNQRSNIRLATHSQNHAWGSDRKFKLNTSGYRGVYPHSRHPQKWCAQIVVRGKTRYLGIFDCPEAAALKVNEAALQYFGEFARLNKVYDGF